jgi:predicted nucleic acid-binding protein
MLVDTNVLSELPRPRPSANVLRWFAAQHSVHISVVTLEELAFGVRRAAPAPRARLGRWLDALLESRPALLDVSPTIARASGELRAAREARGRRVSQADMLIAATALAHGLTLVTRNVRDFEGCGVALFDPFAGV